jgi:putative ABC transport system ATP-binding protein
VLEVLDRVNNQLGTTTAVITHNAAIAQMADRVVRMSSGEIVESHRNASKLAPSQLEW